MTNYEIISHLRKSLKEQRTSDDTLISNRGLMFIANSLRSKLLREEKNLEKELQCLIIDLESWGDCDEGECQVRRSVNIVPNTVRGNDWTVSTKDGKSNLNFSKTSWGKVDFKSKSRIKSNTVSYLFKDTGDGDRLYVYHPTLKQITIEGVPEISIEVKECSDPLSEQFKLNEDKIHQLTQMSIQTYFSSFNNLPNDTINDDQNIIYQPQRAPSGK